MKNRIWLAFLLALLLGALAVPAFAQEPGGDKVCAGGSVVVGPGTTVRSLALFGCSGIVRSEATVTGDAVVMGGQGVGDPEADGEASELRSHSGAA